ncbi:hypothetical protein A1O3_02994 [Capronia epimyces CBS 606.96]|uniref:Beta-lactamase-related domain-containing protein n=1 Tax=Capronia epimyces CBS 606.96 TaxID=1182542 RepID=W9YAR4_9EURO|nr:uncharacterized protein A1O3_02994 [Capronia epimyces CBS 606.96]EXJ89927.1 hypothetical protein A1O3_02994 [Capronia epimyces CBS 606.96]
MVGAYFGEAHPQVQPLTGSEQIRETKKQKVSPFDEDFAKLAEETLAQWHLPGVALAVVDGDETFAEGYGFAVLPDVPVRPSTLFCTGSTTKSFTAAAAALLVHDNDKYPHVKWDTPMNQLIRDDFVLQDDYTTLHATIEDCISHRTGMPGHTLTIAGDSPEAATRNLRNLYIDKELRSGFEYCNIMYIAVSHMLQKVTGEWLGSFLRRRIWEPLKMHATFFTQQEAHQYIRDKDSTLQFARPYIWDPETSSQRECPYWENTAVSGAGSMVSNVLDYAKYTRSMIERSGPLSKEAHADLVTPRAFPPPPDTRFPTVSLYCLGWFSGIYHGEQVIHHSGSIEGFTANIVYLPERKWGVVAMCNQMGPGREVLVWKLVDDFLKVPLEKRIDIYALYKKGEESVKDRVQHAQKYLYPSIPSPPLPTTLPLADYVGRYTHPVYPAFTISLSTDPEPHLIAYAMDMVETTLKLTHVSRDFFTAELRVFRYARDPCAVGRAEFQVDAKGVPKFGAELDFASEDGGGKIWFKRSNDGTQD